MAKRNFKIAIVGGGAAGITVAALLRRLCNTIGVDEIVIIEPSEIHYYQPALTLVGGGVSSITSIRKPTSALIPKSVFWLQDWADEFFPKESRLKLRSGDTIEYEYLVVCPGLEVKWDAIPGLSESLGKHGVCSNYSPSGAVYTWECVQALSSGNKSVFTQPAMPIKCPGAPQKIAYLVADYLRRNGIRSECEVHFVTQSASIFGVPFYAKELVKIAADHAIVVDYGTNLVAVDGPSRSAKFEIVEGEKKGETFVLNFDLLHVTPPQGAPAFVAQSELANATGLVEVDKGSLQHVRYPNVFALGDVASTPNSKTAAAIRKQAPVVARNIDSMYRSGVVQEHFYDGYASCPLTTAYGKVLLAEFIYGGKPAPTLPLDPARERRINWWIKKDFLPSFYWHYMLKGYERFPRHDTNFVETEKV